MYFILSQVFICDLILKIYHLSLSPFDMWLVLAQFLPLYSSQNKNNLNFKYFKDLCVYKWVLQLQKLHE